MKENNIIGSPSLPDKIAGNITVDQITPQVEIFLSAQGNDSLNEKQRPDSASVAPDRDIPVYVKGWRLRLLCLGCALCMFLVNIEVSVVGTSLISITNDLRGFSQMSWVVTGYLVTYTSMLIIWAKLSDIFGRKPVTIVTMFIFIAFSAGCGAAQTMTQLVINRVLQGIGAAGCVSMALVIAYEMVPQSQYPGVAAQIAAAIALGSLVGPLIGGGLSGSSTWRWVFFLNVPAGVATILLLFICIPAKFPHQGQKSYVAPSFREQISRHSLARLDVSGAFLLLAASLLLVTVLLEAPNKIPWNSGSAISLLIVSAALWILFLINERFVTSDKRRVEPIFPWRFLFNRAWMGTLLISFLAGIPYNIILIDIPQRFQAVYGTSSFGAGVRLIPFNFLIAVGCVIVNVFAAKTRIPPIYLVLGGSIIQLVGLALFSTLPTDLTIPHVIYGWEVLSGFGIGVVMGILLLIPPQVVEPRDLAVSSGALLQFRVFGGALGLAIGSTAMNSFLTSRLSDSAIGPERLAAVLETTAVIREFPREMQIEVLTAFAEGYNLQMKIMTGFAGVQVLAVGMLWQWKGKKQIRVVEKKKKIEGET